MSPQSKKQSRPLTPQTGGDYEVRVLTSTSFTVDYVPKSKDLPSQQPTLPDKPREATSRQVKIKLNRAKRARIAAFLKNLQQNNESKLTPQQHQIVKDLGELRRRLHRFSIRRTPTLGKTTGSTERRTAADDLSDLGYGDFLQNSASDQMKKIDELRNHYDILICHAIRNGLEDHPWCVEWILQRRNWGDRKAMHRLYRTHPKLERGIPAAIGGKEKALLKEILRLQLDRKLSLRSIHQRLRAGQLYNKPWSTFQKWLNNPRRRWIIERPSEAIINDASEFLVQPY